MKDSEKLAGSKACVDGLVTSWRKTNLTDIEEWSLEEAMIWGVFKLALYLLPTSDYQKLKNYVLEEYGHDVGGAVGTFKYGVIENNAPGSFHEREKGEWISVSSVEEMPKECLWVTHKGADYAYVEMIGWDSQRGCRTEDGGFRCVSDRLKDIVAYMPYSEPEPYKEGDNE